MPQPIPDPTLFARLQLSARDFDWAASLIQQWQHEEVDDLWSAHRQLSHLIAVETENFQPRIARILAEDHPKLVTWDTDAYNARYRPEGDITALAVTFMAERARTVWLFEGLAPEQWRRTGTWPDGQDIDLAWLAEKALWHSMDHYAQLLDLHGEFDRIQAS